VGGRPIGFVKFCRNMWGTVRGNRDIIVSGQVGDGGGFFSLCMYVVMVFWRSCLCDVVMMMVVSVGAVILCVSVMVWMMSVRELSRVE
jgi:hypothetical protein